MINIGIYADYRFVASATPTGVSKHMVNMVKGLSLDERFDVSGVVARDQAGKMGDLSFLPSMTMPLSFKVSREIWSRINYPQIDRWSDKLDWVYCSNHDLIAKNKVKYAVTFHGAPDIDPRFKWNRGTFDKVVSRRKLGSYKKIAERADLVLVVSEWLKELMTSDFKLDEDRISVVGNGVSNQFFEAGWKRLQTTSPSALASDTPYILAVGGLNYIDGGDYVVELAKVLKDSGANFRIKVAGSHNDVDLANFALESGVVDLLGHVDEKEVVELMRWAKLLYMPSRYESFGMTAVEAMAAGCPLVVSCATALPEVVGDCGIYVDSEKTDDVFACVKEIVENGNQYNELCQRAYKHASSLYTWDKCVERLSQSLIEHS